MRLTGQLESFAIDEQAIPGRLIRITPIFTVWALLKTGGNEANE